MVSPNARDALGAFAVTTLPSTPARARTTGARQMAATAADEHQRVELNILRGLQGTCHAAASPGPAPEGC